MKAKEFTEQYNGGKGPGSDYRAYDEPDQRNNWVVKVDGKKWKVFSNQKSANRAAFTVQQKYGKKTEVYATMDPVSEAKSSAREKLVKDFEKIAGYKINDKEAWYQAVNDYYKGKRDSWPDPKEFGLKESIHLNHELEPGTYKHVTNDIIVTIDDDGSVEFMQPAEWEIEGDQEYLEYVQDMLNEPSLWTTDLNEALTEEQFDEAAGEKDACYHKVKSRYKVWPSAYASGALVKCRKVGAKNWGNKSKK